MNKKDFFIIIILVVLSTISVLNFVKNQMYEVRFY